MVQRLDQKYLLKKKIKSKGIIRQILRKAKKDRIHNQNVRELYGIPHIIGWIM